MEARNCPVTDVGIKGLCVSIDDFGKENVGLGQCKSLQTLDIFGTKVTIKGVQLALENLPDLKDFDFDYQIQVLANLLRGPARKNLPCVPNLTSLHNIGSMRVDSTVCQRGDIELVAAACLSVNKVHIDSDAIVKNGQTDVTVLELLKLQKLCEFRIEGDWMDEVNDCELTFNGGVLPLLKHFSSSLTSLSIECLSNIVVNIRAIVENCPKLQTLKISDCKISPPIRLEDEPNPSKRMKTNFVFENLTTLELIGCDDLTSGDLDLLLASPALKELKLWRINFPFDDCLQKAANLHNFRNLKYLHFSFVVHVTKAGIDLLMIDDCPLKAIELFHCQLLNVADIEEWKGVALEKNWNVVFQFKPISDLYQ